MPILFILLPLFVFSGFLHGEAPPLIHFRDLTDASPSALPHNQIVRIRGFVYQAMDGRWILASEPNLKTCCVASKSKITQQIFLQGVDERLPPSTAVLLEGIFRVEPRRDAQEQLIQLYELGAAQIVLENKPWPWLPFCLIAAFIGAAGCLIYKSIVYRFPVW